MYFIKQALSSLQHTPRTEEEQNLFNAISIILGQKDLCYQLTYCVLCAAYFTPTDTLPGWKTFVFNKSYIKKGVYKNIKSCNL